MAFYEEINTDYCPNCKAKVEGEGSYERITDDSRCSSCSIPLKIVRVEVVCPTESPYTVYSIEIDMHTLRDQR